MSYGWRSIALAALLTAACADGGPSGPVSSLSMHITLPPLAAQIVTLKLTVLGAGTCSAQGDVTGSALAGLTDLTIARGTPGVFKVSPGMRTFSVVAFDSASARVARGCASKTLDPGGAYSIDITLHDLTAADGGLDGNLADDAADIDADLTDGAVFDGQATDGGADATMAIDARPVDASPIDAAPAPGNDLCSMASATALVQNLTLSGQSNVGATSQVTTTCGGNARDVFYSLTIPAAGGPRELIAQVVAGFDASVALLRADCTTVVTCTNATIMGETLDVGNVAPGTYFVSVQGIAGATGSFSIGYTTAPPKPVNDQCPGVVTLTAAAQGGTLANGSHDVTATCGDPSAADVVYQLTVPAGAAQHVTVAVTGAAGFDPVVYMRSGACAAGAQIGCSQLTTGASETLDVSAVAPGTYFVWVASQGLVSGAGTFTIQATLTPPPANDTCAAATALVAGAQVAGSTVGSSNESTFACMTAPVRDNVYTLDTTGMGSKAVLVTATPDATGWPLGTAMRATPCGNAVDLSCVGGGFAAQSRYIYQPNLAAAKYDVFVGGAGGVGGAYTVRFDTAAARTLTGGYWKLAGSSPFASIVGNGGTDVVGYNGAADIDQAYAVTLPFSFNFYGSSFNSVNISDNFYLSFGATPGNGTSVNSCPITGANPKNAIAVFWDIGFPVSTAGTPLQTKTEGVAPNRRFIIEWKDWDLAILQASMFRAQGFAVTQQAILYENGDIELRYGPRANNLGATTDCGANRHLGCSATVGLVNAAATENDPSSCNGANSVAPDTFVYFVHPR